jgi:hypothetical protein
MNMVYSYIMSMSTPVSVSVAAPVITPGLPLDVFKALNKMIHGGLGDEFIALFQTLSLEEQKIYAQTPLNLYDHDAVIAFNPSLSKKDQTTD